jgi:predicted Rossmann-fold nucleotide-binding protein
MRIVVYGSASKDTPQAYKDASFELGKLLAQRGHICVNGGGNTGCMGSLSDGCLSNGGKASGTFAYRSPCSHAVQVHLCSLTLESMRAGRGGDTRDVCR